MQKNSVTQVMLQAFNLCLVQMAATGDDEVSRQVRVQHRSVSFISKTELVQIDSGDESHRGNEDCELNEMVRNLNQPLLTYALYHSSGSFTK